MLSTNDSMSIDTTPTQNGTDSTDTITDLRDLRVGDRVVFGDRTQPLTVADLGERVHGTGDDEIATPIVRVEGDWEGANAYVLAHVIKQLGNDGLSVELAEQPKLTAHPATAVSRGDYSRGERVDVVRVEEVTPDE